MTAVILAAGVASRLRPLTNNIPKSLLEVGGKPLLLRNLETLISHGVTRVIIVTGFLHEMIESYVRSLHLGIEIEFVYNPVFDHTNNNYSLWLARAALNGEGMILLDADILFDQRIFASLVASSHSDALMMRASDRLGHEEIKCELDANGAVRRIGKHIDPNAAAGESIGIEKFSPTTAAQLFDVLSRRHVHDEFYEASFQEVINQGAKIYAIDTGGFPCMEIDTPEDLSAAELLAQQLQ